MTGYNKIKPKYKVKRMDTGGTPPTNGISPDGISKGADFLSDSLNVFNQPGKANVGVGTAQGALKGAALGTEILPGIGTIVGGVIGGATSLISGLNAKKKMDADALELQKQNYQQQLNRSNATLANYNTTGTVNNQFYAKGGKIIPKYIPTFPDGGKLTSNGKPVSVLNPLVTEHADGTVRAWGETPTVPIQDPVYYRVHGGQNIPGTNIAGIRAQYHNDPKIQQLLKRNIAPNGEVPMFSADDADILRNLIANPAPQQVVQVQPQMAEGGNIHIKPSHEGKFTAYKKRTGKTTEEALHSSDPHVRKMAQFAANASKWKHADGGVIANPDYEAEKGEVVQGNPQLEESQELASDIHKVGGETHENGGTMGVGGDRVFSDRLKVSPMLQMQLKAMRVPIKANSTYADVSTKLGNMKGKYEDKMDSTFTPSVNTAKKMLGTINNALDQTFNDQELQKHIIPNNAKNMNLAYGGKIKKYDGGGEINPFQNQENELQQKLIGVPNGNSTIPFMRNNNVLSDARSTGVNEQPLGTLTGVAAPTSDTPTNDGQSILSRISQGISDNSGQLINAGAYLANLGSINKLNTSVKRNYLTAPTYNYNNRSGEAIYNNQKTFNTGVKALSGSSQGVNAANIGAMYASTVDANGRINNAENNRKDAYDKDYNDRADKVNMVNTEIGNQANDISRDLYNQKNVALPVSARNAFLQGVMGNNQVKANNKAQQIQMKLAALMYDKNNILGRYKNKLKNVGLNMEDN